MLRYFILLCVVLFLSGCSTAEMHLPMATAPLKADHFTPPSLNNPHFSNPNVTGTYTKHPEQCVPYARRISGINIYGDAHTWWNRAEPKYKRGNQPRVGSVFVLANAGKMTYGHVAVVRDVINARHINVTHSNWGNTPEKRRVTYQSMRVEDISANNDWTRVRFWNYEENCFGFPYKALGFIYK